MRTKKIKAAVFILIVMVCGISFIGCDAEGSSSLSGASEGTSSPSSAVPSGDNTTDTGNQAGDNTTDKVYNIIYNNTKGINNLTPVTFKTSDTIVLPTISKDGWTFGGWSDSSTDENVITGWSVGDHTSDVTLWAVWTANTYTVTLQNDGDVSGDASVTATFDANLPSLQTKPSKVGYNFGGYWTAADGQGTQYIDVSGDGCKKWDLTSDTTLIAFFMEHGTHLITYNNLNGAAAPSKKTFKETETVELEEINVTGYSFDGWFDAAEGGSKVTSWSAGTKTDNVIVYAHWTAEQYDITYKDEGENVEFSGTMTGEPTKHTYGTPTALPVPTKTGYEFGGWFTSTDCSDSSIDTLGATSFIADITLYAKWNICEYDIVYKNVQGLNNTNVTSYTVLNNVSLSDLSAQGWMF
ncbi:MAG: InlB B-repeat-containing protein, partial [Spirochaetales bacterium]|nr:InlB B-repeat-containing protein [Spirochaetales bacterium]